MLLEAVNAFALLIEAFIDVESVKTCFASVALEEIDVELLEGFLKLF